MLKSSGEPLAGGCKQRANAEMKNKGINILEYDIVKWNNGFYHQLYLWNKRTLTLAASSCCVSLQVQPFPSISAVRPLSNQQIIYSTNVPQSWEKPQNKTGEIQWRFSLQWDPSALCRGGTFCAQQPCMLPLSVCAGKTRRKQLKDWGLIYRKSPTD